jgi:glucose/arabinose dehydrogenase
MRNVKFAFSGLALLLCISGFSQTYPAGFAQTVVSNTIATPTVMAFAPDGRIFVAQQNGQLRVIKNGTLLTTPFVTLTVNASGERGLIGIALDPSFPSNQYVYLYYTVPGTPLRNRVSRYTANGDVAVAGSEVIVLDLDPLSTATNHNGGALDFGPDGKLYVAIGDNANGANAQNLNTYHGKILRINPDGSVPSGNPFPTGSEQMRRVWAYGLRNPYTMAFQPGTGKLFVNDVGQSSWEEINDATMGGRNFGWPTAEGNSTNPNFANPVYAYGRGSTDGVGCALTGGTFFNPSSTNYPSTYYGKYFFLDYCSGWINTIDPNAAPAVRSSFATGISGSPVIMEVGNDGNLYYLSRAAGALIRIIYNNSSAPFITRHPANTTANEGTSISFSVSSIGSTPLTYQWQKNNQDIVGATDQIFSIANVQPLDAATYRVIVSNGSGNATSNNATLTVTPINDAPTATITSPAEGTKYVAGTTISFSGTGTDIEDGPLAANRFSWQINFHHGAHVHDQPPLLGITSGTFTIPNEGETADDVWYRITLTVTDSDGLTGSDFVDVLPQKSTLSFSTNPTGLQITLDDQPFNTPGSVVSVEGVLRKIGAVSPQIINGTTYVFQSWAHGGSATQTIATPTDDMSYTATFSVATPVISKHPLTISRTEEETASFTVEASAPSPMTYQWQKNNVDILGATNQIFSIANVQPGDAGQYRVVVSTSAGSATSNAATLTVTPINDVPIANIITPSNGAQYVAGTTLSFSGTGTDVEDGTLAANRFSWQINFHHDGEVTALAPMSGIAAGTFNIPNEGVTSDEVWYKVILTVTDSEGLFATDFADIYPLKSMLDFATNPPGLSVLLDDQPLSTPNSILSVQGMKRKLGVETPQMLNGKEYIFHSWSHGGAAAQTIVTPSDNTTFTANFAVVAAAENKLGVTDFEIYPNPVEGDNAIIKVYVGSPTKGVVRIVDMLSRKNFSQEFNFQVSENNIEIPTHTFEQGLHIVILEVDGRTMVKKLIKR